MKKAAKDLTRIAMVLEDLRKQGINQATFAKAIGYPESNVSDIKNGKRQPPMDFLLQVNEVYHYSIDYMLDKSDDMKDEASEILSALSKLSDGYTTTPKTYTDSDGNIIEGQFLLLNINEHLYDFLVAYDHATRLQQEQGLKSYNEEIQKIKQEYMKHKGTGENRKCILIPSNNMIEIVGSKKRERQTMDEILDLGTELSDYLD